MVEFKYSDLVILVPMLGRPKHVDPLLASISNSVPGSEVLFVCSPNDHRVIEAVENAGCDYARIPYHPIGDYARKINYGVSNTTKPLIFLGASDLLFHNLWFEYAVQRMARGVGVIGTNDLGNPRVISGDHSTHSLVTREYAELGTIDNPRLLLHEGYPHEFVDDEFIETAKHRGAFVAATDSLVEHLHPNWGKGEPDNLYQQQRQRMALGRRIYMRRKRLWT